MTPAAHASPARPARTPASLPVALLATLWAGSTAWFFTSLDTGALAFWSGLVPALWYTFCFWMLLRSSRPAFWRRIFFVSIALLFFPSFIGNLVDHRGSMTLDSTTVAAGETPFCHIAFTMTLVPQFLQAGFIFPARMTQSYASVMSMLVIWILASLTLGRGWCSWVCFYGGWDDGFSRLARKARLDMARAPEALRWFSFAMLGFVVLASMVSLTAVYCDWLCPFKMVTEYAAITSFGSWLAAVLFISGFTGMVVVLPLLTRKRFQCATFCPFGALQSLLDRISPFRIRIDSASCVSCMACVAACPVNALDADAIRKGADGPRITCTKCGECIDTCPKGAICIDFRRKKGGPPDLAAGPGSCSASSPGAAGAPVRSLVRWGKELLSPRILFTAMAWTLGMIVSSGFGTDTVGRLLSLALTGTFTSPGGQP